MSHSVVSTPSPCMGKCTLNDHNICKGCFRTLNEILHWTAMPEADKQATVMRCNNRRQQRMRGQKI